MRALGAGMAGASAADAVRQPPDLDPGLAGRQDRPVDGIDNGFVAGYRVRFDEAGADGRVRASALLRYAQDIAWRHSEDLGFDRTWYTERGRWWVVRSVELDLFGAVPMGHTLRLATAVVGHRRIWARRRGEFRLADGTLAALAVTDWVIIDGRGRIVRIPEDFGEAFPNPELDAEIIRVVPPEPPADAARHAIRVRPQDLDPMGHANNAVYLDWVEEAIAAAGASDLTTALGRRVSIEYAASAEGGDDLEARTWPSDRGWWVRLVRPADGAEVLRALVAPLPG
ncbi:MAG TPA: acyl-ACP thioesterase domain-containing protein [Candidatus Limnocylindrales bacterium]|nr:acyl-ACP thioesterase domain-containing protein [Candidatus Limnocylindrales bacterium]